MTDMITLARNGAIADAVLLSGDEDLRVGVQQAQEFGVRIHLLGIHPSRGSQSQFLLQEADSCHEWMAGDVARFLSHNARCAAKAVQPVTAKPISTPPQAHTRSPAEVGSEAAQAVDRNLIEGLLAHYESSRQLPAEIDRPLLGKAKVQLGILTPAEKRTLRESFVAALRERIGQSR